MARETLGRKSPIRATIGSKLIGTVMKCKGLPAEHRLADLEQPVAEGGRMGRRSGGRGSDSPYPDRIDHHAYGEPTMKTQGSAVWQGGIKDGKGAISTKSGALKDYPYGFSSRFEGKPGTNPEELIGAAHAGCFTMALSLILGEAGLRPSGWRRTADVTLDKVGRRLRHHGRPPDPEGQDPGRGPGEVRGARRQGEGRLSRLQAPQGRDHPGRDAGGLTPLRLDSGSREDQPRLGPSWDSSALCRSSSQGRSGRGEHWHII